MVLDAADGQCRGPVLAGDSAHEGPEALRRSAVISGRRFLVLNVQWYRQLTKEWPIVALLRLEMALSFKRPYGTRDSR